jgi:hypothetical protein
MLHPNLVYLGVFIQLLGGFSYLKDTIKGRVQPNKVSWLMWSLAPLIAFTAEVSQGVGVQSLTTFVVGFVPLIVFFASFLNKKAQWNLTRFDLVCGLLSLGGLLLWFFTGVGNIAILFSIVADGLAGIPTLIKAYREPESETAFAYFTGVINAGITLMTITLWNFEHFAFPLYLVIVNLLLTILIHFKLGRNLSKSNIHGEKS